MTALFDANGVSSIELFTDTLQRVTTDWGCKVSRQNYPGSFYDKSQGKANKRKSVIGNGNKLLCDDPGEVESSFFCYAATVLSPHRNVLIFTQRMHKPT